MGLADDSRCVLRHFSWRQATTVSVYNNCSGNSRGWGIATARKAKKFVFSKLIAKSAIKIAAYVSIYALVALVEKGFADGFMVTSSVMAAILISSELWSILGHISIAYPNFTATKIIRKYLKGEMSKKLGIPEDELDDILDNKE